MYQHIMVPLDGSELAECVLPHVEAIAGGCSVNQVTLVRVVEPLHLYGGIDSGFIDVAVPTGFFLAQSDRKGVDSTRETVVRAS